VHTSPSPHRPSAPLQARRNPGRKYRQRQYRKRGAAHVPRLPPPVSRPRPRPATRSRHPGHRVCSRRVSDLKNVLVFALGGMRWAAELRYVREVISLGFVTTVPTAPPGISGVFNLRGAITPVIDLGPLVGRPPHPPPRQGEGALLLDVDGATAALRVDNVDEISTLPAVDDGVRDGRGRVVPLVDPRQLLRRALHAAQAVRGDDPEVTLDGFRRRPADALNDPLPPLDLDGDSTLG
jgi:chemotaxis signal transduction protein